MWRTLPHVYRGDYFPLRTASLFTHGKDRLLMNLYYYLIDIEVINSFPKTAQCPFKCRGGDSEGRWLLSLVWHSGLIIWVDHHSRALMVDELGMRLFFVFQNQLLHLLRWTVEVKSCSKDRNTLDPQISTCRQKRHNWVETRAERTKINHNQINKYINRKLQMEKVAEWKTTDRQKKLHSECNLSRQTGAQKCELSETLAVIKLLLN